MRRWKLSIAYKAVGLACGLGVYGVLVYMNAAAGQRHVFTETLTYYTCQSNLLIDLALAMGIAGEAIGGRRGKLPGWCCLLQAVAAVNGVFLAIAYQLVFVKGGSYGNGGDFLMHLLLPLLMLGDALLFGQQNGLRLWQSVFALVPAGGYMLYTFWVFYPTRQYFLYPELLSPDMYARPLPWLVTALCGLALFLLFAGLWLRWRKKKS